MGSILSCDCSTNNKETEAANVTATEGGDDENFIKFRQSTTHDSPAKYKTLSSERI